MRRQLSSASSPANTDAAYGATLDTPTHGSDPRRKLQNLQHLPPAMQSHHHDHHHHHQHHAWSSSSHNGRRPMASLPSRIHCVFPDDPDTVYIVRRRDVRHMPQTLPRPPSALDQHQHRPVPQEHGSLPQQGSARLSAASTVSNSEDRHLLMCRPFAASAVHSGFAAQQTAVPARPTRAATAACPRGKRCPYAHVTVTASTPRHRRHVHPAGHAASGTDRQLTAAACDTACNSAEDSSRMFALRRVGSDGNVVDAIVVVLAVTCLASPNPAGDPSGGDDTTTPLSSDAANDGNATADPAAPASDPSSAASVSPRPSPIQGAAPDASSANTSDGCYRHTDARRNQDEDDPVPASSTLAVEPRRGVPPGRPRDHNDGNRAVDFNDGRMFFIHRTAVLPTRPIYELYAAAASSDAPPQEPPLLTTETTLPPRPPSASAAVDHAAASNLPPPLLHHCAHWLRTGVCDFGADCRFVHSLVGLGAATPAEALAAVGESVPQPVHRGRRRFPFQHDPYDANTSSFRAASSADA